MRCTTGARGSSTLRSPGQGRDAARPELGALGVLPDSFSVKTQMQPAAVSASIWLWSSGRRWTRGPSQPGRRRSRRAGHRRARAAPAPPRQMSTASRRPPPDPSSGRTSNPIRTTSAPRSTSRSRPPARASSIITFIVADTNEDVVESAEMCRARAGRRTLTRRGVPACRGPGAAGWPRTSAQQSERRRNGAQSWLAPRQTRAR